MKKIYRQTYVTEKLPTEFGIHFTDEGELKFIPAPNSFFNMENQERNPRWWLEEIELPNDEDVINEFGIELAETHEANKYYNKTLKGKYEGAKWLRDIVLGIPATKLKQPT